jgi:hypothetical protein
MADFAWRCSELKVGRDRGTPLDNGSPAENCSANWRNAQVQAEVFRRLALFDPLTRLYNRRFAEKR